MLSPPFRLLLRPSQLSPRNQKTHFSGAPPLVGCLACPVLLTRRENLRIRDLLGPLPQWLLPKGIACFLLVPPFFVLAEHSPLVSSTSLGTDLSRTGN